MSRRSSRISRLAPLALLCALRLLPAQQPPAPADVPPNFHPDAVFAAHARAALLGQTVPATGTAVEVLNRLVRHLPPAQNRFAWDLRLASQAGNVFSSPDGTIFVDADLAQFLGSRSGLWAAALSHEIEHIVRRDWARRFLFEKSLRASGGAQLTIGDPAASGSWTDPKTSARLLDNFCRTQELEADAEGLLLMARAGYHPAFMPALYHILQAQPHLLGATLQDATHPLWDDRYQMIRTHLAAAGGEFDRLWPAPYASPGGNPPIVVYAGTPSAHRAPSSELELLVPLHCDNLYGSVEVVLHVTAPGSAFTRNFYQVTGCTSDHTLVTFVLGRPDLPPAHSRLQVKVSVLDDRGVLLTRALAPKGLR